MNSICITVEDETRRLRAVKLSQELGIDIISKIDAEKFKYQFSFTTHGLELLALHSQGKSRLFVDFLKGAMGYRRIHGGGYRQAIARAVGIKSRKQSITVLDATAGLGRDAFILAGLGCHLHLVERSTIIAALLKDGLERALHDSELYTIVKERIKVSIGDAQSILAAIRSHMDMYLHEEQHHEEEENHLLEKNTLNEQPDVVYLDPMFPEENKRALTTIDLRIIRDIVGPDLDAESLFQMALKVAKKRVVVKRSIQAPTISKLKPNFSLIGKKNRYDIYIVQK